VAQDVLSSFREAALRIQTELFLGSDSLSLFDQVVRIIVDLTPSQAACIAVPSLNRKFLEIVSYSARDPEILEPLKKITLSLDPGRSASSLSFGATAFLERRAVGPVASTESPLLRKVQDQYPAFLSIKSLMASPILVSGGVAERIPEGQEPYGVLIIDSLQSELFTDEIRQVVLQFVQSLGISLDRLNERRRILDLLEKNTEEKNTLEIQNYLSRILLDIGRMLRDNQNRDSPAVLREALDHLAESLDLPVAWLGMVPREEKNVSMIALAGSGRKHFEGIQVSIDTSLPEGRGLVGESVLKGRPREADDIRRDVRFSSWRDRFSAAGLESGLVDTTRTKQGDILVLALYRKKPGRFPAEIVELISGLVRDLAAFLDRLQAETERACLSSYQSAVRDIQNGILKATNSQEMFDLLVRTIVVATPLIGAYVLVPDKKDESFFVISADAETDSLVRVARSIRFLKSANGPVADGSLSLQAFYEKKGQGPVDPFGFPAEKKMLEEYPDLRKIRSASAWPLLVKQNEEPYGVFVVWSADHRHFTPELMHLLDEIAMVLSLGIERMVREEEVTRLSLIAKKTTDLILLTDSEGKILWANDSFGKKLGYGPEEMTGRDFTDLVFGQDAGQQKEILKRLIRNGEFFDTLLRYQSREGSTFWVRVNATVLFSPSGTPRGYIVVESDVTELKDSEEKARIAAVFYRALSETMQTLWTLSDSSQVTLAALLNHLKAILEAEALFLGTVSSRKIFGKTLSYLGPPQWLSGLVKSCDPGRPEGRGPAGVVLRTGQSLGHLMNDTALPESLREQALRFGIVGSLTASSARANGERILLKALFAKEDLLRADSAELFNRITMEIASYLDRKERRERNEKVERFRTARQIISKELLSADTEEEIFGILARTLSAKTEALAVDWLAPEGDRLKRKALEGPFSSVIGTLPADLSLDRSPGGPFPTPVRAFKNREPVIVKNPGRDPSMLDHYRTPSFEKVGLVAAFPIPARPPDAPPTGVVTLFIESPETFDDPLLTELIRDILESASLGIERLRLLRRMKDLSTLDPLTNLLNRRGLGLSLPGLLSNVRRNGGQVLLGILDLDDFKAVNDQFGHAAGDELLVMMARRLKETLREGDLVARPGGDEFVVVMQHPPTTGEGIDPFLNAGLHRIKEALSLPYILHSGPEKGLAIGFSMGLTFYPKDDSEPDGLLRHADEALYSIKRQKGKRSSWWSFWNESSFSEAFVGDPLAEAKALLFSEIYGPEAQGLIEKASGALGAGVRDFSEIFYQTLARDKRIEALLNRLSPEEFLHLKERQSAHLSSLLSPFLKEEEHRQSARRLGRIHAMVGLTPSDMVEAMRIYLTTLQETIRKLAIPLGDRTRLLSLVTHRSGVELSLQIAGMSDLEMERQSLVLGLTNSLIQLRSWPDFIRLALTSLIRIEGMTGVALLRPAEEGQFVIEFSSGDIRFLVREPADENNSGEPEKDFLSEIRDLMKEVWQDEEILSVPGVYGDPRIRGSRRSLLEKGIRSLALLPLKDPDDHLFAALLIVSPYPGYFETPSAQVFENGLLSLFRQGRHRFEGTGPLKLPVFHVPHQSLRSLLAAKKLILEYQPVVDFSDGLCRKVEALARIVSDNGEFVYPHNFLGAFGHSELADLFRQGLEAGLAQVREWEGQGYVLDLALNIPPVVLLEPHLFAWLDQALKGADMPPSRLHLELLESEEIRDTARQIRAAEKIVDRGIHLDMDDLGAGYSSLLRLRTMPFSAIKIDQGLVRGHSGTPGQLISLVGSLVKLIQGLGHLAVIEGLENFDLIEAARILGADGGQGYALSRPIPSKMVPEWIRNFVLPPRMDMPVSPLGQFAREWINAHYETGSEPFSA